MITVELRFNRLKITFTETRANLFNIDTILEGGRKTEDLGTIGEGYSSSTCIYQ